jgi:hypothetical protein
MMRADAGAVRATFFGKLPVGRRLTSKVISNFGDFYVKLHSSL